MFQAKYFPNLMLAYGNVDGPLQCVVSDMTAFRISNVYYELTLYMDLWNNEILTYALSARKGGQDDLYQRPKQSHRTGKAILT